MYRADGYRVYTDSPMYELAAFFMNKRYDACNYIKQEIDLDKLHDYTTKCRKEGIPMSTMAIIIAGYLRVVSQNPYLNRFVVNKRIYARNHFCVSFVTLTQGGEDSTINKIYFNLDDDIFTVNRKINEAIEKCQDAPSVTAMDKIAAKLVRMPGLLSVIIGFLKFADKHLPLPLSLIDASPFHNSLFVTNLASIRTNAIYHHIYDFGTTGVFLSMGKPLKKLVKDGDTIVEKKIMELGITTDERIADGHYYGRCFKEVSKYFTNPELLETRPEKIVTDKDIRVRNPKFFVK